MSPTLEATPLSVLLLRLQAVMFPALIQSSAHATITMKALMEDWEVSNYMVC
jgi:hypothetical protein